MLKTRIRETQGYSVSYYENNNNRYSTETETMAQRESHSV